MSNKKVVAGAVIGVIILAAVCYILYLQSENEKLADENKKIKHPEPLKRSPIIINLDTVPKPIRKEFNDIASHTHIEKSKQTFQQAYERVLFLKKYIEDRDGYKIFYKNGERMTKEKDVHILYDLTWFQTNCDVNKEVNNGRGPVDFKISVGLDQTLVEFKLASNRKLKMNLQKQVAIYAKANNNPKKIVVILFFDEKEESKVGRLLKEFDLHDKKHIVLIDARNDNKPSASKSKIDYGIVNELAEANAV